MIPFCSMNFMLLGLEREDMEDAEEEEALKIQKRLAEEIDVDQFELFKVNFVYVVYSSDYQIAMLHYCASKYVVINF